MLVAPGIHHFDTDPFNWYVLEERGRLTLVDAGFPGHYAALENGLQSIGRTVQDIDAVLITHAHADHMGFASRVATESGAPIFIHELDAHTATRMWQLPWTALLSNAWRPYMAGMLTTAVVNGVFSRARIPNATTCKGGERLDVPGRPTVISTPGHTRGHAAFYLESQRILLSGDSIVTRDLYTGQHGAPRLTRSRLNADLETARRSLARLEDLGPVTILPGHGRLWRGDAREAVSLALRA
jgi:glyoxylase-like metal-dependent hydrolase (beta-lactamase superfamily II)